MIHDQYSNASFSKKIEPVQYNPVLSKVGAMKGLTLKEVVARIRTGKYLSKKVSQKILLFL